VYLASRSPRRRELLHQIGLAHDCIAADVDEAPLREEGPEAYVRRLALAKARAGWHAPERTAPRPVLGADTAIALDGEILGKPVDDTHAVAMLWALSGRSHEVWTGVAAVRGDRELVEASRSRVWLAPLADAEIRAYVATGEPLDKAGAYAIQGRAAAFVERLEGSCSGVVGLPLHETLGLLATLQAAPEGRP
jgi:septum formation protein